MPLTTKNKQAIDLYLSTDPECNGSGPDCWQRVYGTKSRASAWNGWSRMMKDDEAQAYFHHREAELSQQLARQTLYDRYRIIDNLVKVHQDAMQKVCVGKVIGKRKAKDRETGEETETIEYAPVEAMYSHSDAIRAGVEAIRAMGDHPDQRAEGAGVMVNINIDTVWRGNPDGDPIDVTETPDEPPPAPKELPGAPSVVVIGKRSPGGHRDA